MMKKGDKDSHDSIDVGDDDGSIYYFAYGPVVNDMVRQRRGIKTTEIRAAYLPEYRLTFAIGGLANIVPRRGYDVHGLLMKLESVQDWNLVQEFDAGSTHSIHEVIPYHDGYCIDDADTPAPYQKPIRAHFVEFSKHVEDRLLDSPIEHLPSDRYLNLIAQGMRRYHVDSDYVENEIMTIPFVPKRQPEEFEHLPHKRKFLPKITFKKYLGLCRKEQGKSIVFILQNGVFQTITAQPDFEDPAARWLQRNGHGQPDCSLMFHKMLVDPDIPLCNELSEMTPLHFAWVENHVVELTQQYNFKCHKVAILKEEPTEKNVVKYPSTDRNVAKRSSFRFNFEFYNSTSKNTLSDSTATLQRNSTSKNTICDSTETLQTTMQVLEIENEVEGNAERSSRGSGS